MNETIEILPLNTETKSHNFVDVGIEKRDISIAIISITTQRDKKMPKVNLDALIPREDFEATGTNSPSDLGDTLSIPEFTSEFIHRFFKKPDFQRETSQWDANQICDFLESFVNEDLIPSIILWRSKSGFYFVIDGAHRLGALRAWIFDDYGDGSISQKFYDGDISDDEKQIAEHTRKVVNKRIGIFSERAKDLGLRKLRVQWVQGGADKAETSFFKINQQGVELNKTEKILLKSRKKWNCIAARAIWKGGRGHKFWATFSAENQNEIQRIASEIHKILFTPPLKTPVKNLHLPIAGRVSASLPLIFDFINSVNKIPSDFGTTLTDDATGDETIRYLGEVRKIAWRINSVHASSLGLDSIVYFYNLEGQHKATSFRAVILWVVEMQSKNSFRDFIKVRAEFEELLLKYNDMIQDIGRKLRQSKSSYFEIRDFYNECIKYLSQGYKADEAMLEVIKNTKFNYLKVDLDSVRDTRADFSTEVKSSAYIREALATRVRCGICNARLHENAITVDHIQRKRDDGLGTLDNAQLTHPYCNSTIKQ